MSSLTRSLREIQREIDRLSAERQRWWRAWAQREDLLTPEMLLQRREQLRVLERRLAKLWLEKRLRLAKCRAGWDERTLWLVLARMERDELDAG